MNTYIWYTQLIKPFWAPPAWLFGPVWMVLYLIIGISFGFVFYKAFVKEISWKTALPFALNLVFNFSFTLIQFGIRSNLLASVDILLVVGTLIWALWLVWNTAHKFRWVVYANIPYLLWGIFATALQLTITYLNR